MPGILFARCCLHDKTLMFIVPPYRNSLCREISELEEEKEAERIELETKLEDATKMLATALKPKSGQGFGKSRKVP